MSLIVDRLLELTRIFSEFSGELFFRYTLDNKTFYGGSNHSVWSYETGTGLRRSPEKMELRLEETSATIGRRHFPLIGRRHQEPLYVVDRRLEAPISSVGFSNGAFAQSEPWDFSLKPSVDAKAPSFQMLDEDDDIIVESIEPPTMNASEKGAPEVGGPVIAVDELRTPLPEFGTPPASRNLFIETRDAGVVVGGNGGTFAEVGITRPKQKNVPSSCSDPGGIGYETQKTRKEKTRGAKPYICKSCGNGFKSYSNLLIHSRIHTGDRPYRCDLCGHGFAQLGNLNAHKRIHSGERPFRCNFCGKGFAQSSNLRSHIRVHLGQKPFTCKICQRGFSRQNLLTLHSQSCRQMANVNGSQSSSSNN